MADYVMRLMYDEATYEDDLRLLTGVPNGVAKAMTRALNRTIVGSRADATRLVRQTSTLASKVIRDAQIVRKAWWEDDEVKASLTVRSSRVPLARYEVRTAAPAPGRKRRRVAVRVLRDHSPAVLRHGFQATMASGHKGIYTRATADRLPIHEETGPSVQFFLRKDTVIDGLEEAADARFRKELEHQVDYLLRGGK